MMKIVHIKLEQVKKANAAFEKLLKKDPIARQERKEFDQFVKAEKKRRDEEHEAPEKEGHTISCDPFFSLTPLNPYAFTFDRANPEDPFVEARLYSTGVCTGAIPPYSLTAQYNSDQLLLCLDPVLDTDEAINDIANDIYRKCTIQIIFRGYNIGAARQYLLVYRLKKGFGSPIAQFFIGDQPVRAEAITQSPYDDIAILLDVPEAAYVFPTMRLAADDNDYKHGFYFMGVNCYLL